MTVTLADLAKATSLSVSTVSRALSVPDMVNEKTRQRVRDAAAELGYVAHTVSGDLDRSGLIGLVVPDIANPFFPPIIKAVQVRARQKGLRVLIGDIDERPAEEVRLAREMQERVDGLIVVSPRTPQDEIGEFTQLGPLVVINRAVPGVTSVIIEDDNAIEQAVEHLVALGHNTICYLNGPKRSWSNGRRRDAVEAACRTCGVELREFGAFEPQIQAGVRAADLVFASEATAVIAYDDLIALGVMARLAERGVTVGKQISVIGIDDSPMSGMAYPSLTSIHVPGADAGTAAVDLLLDLIAEPSQEEPKSLQLEASLILRGSTGLRQDGMLAQATT